MQLLGKNIKIEVKGVPIVINIGAYVFAEDLINLGIGNETTNPIELLLESIEENFKENYDFLKKNNLHILVTDRLDAIVVFDLNGKKTKAGGIMLTCRKDMAARMIGAGGEYLKLFVKEINSHFGTEFGFIQLVLTEDGATNQDGKAYKNSVELYTPYKSKVGVSKPAGVSHV